MMHKRYTKEQLTAVEAQRLAQEIAMQHKYYWKHR